MATNKTIIIVGGAHAGANAAIAARQCNEHAQILLVEQAPFFSPKFDLKRDLFLDDNDLGETITSSSVTHPSRSHRHSERCELDHFVEQFNLDVLLGTRARALDMDARSLVVEGASGLERLSFHTLIFATGSASTSLSISGLSGPRVCHFRTREDLATIRAASVTNKRAVVVGCGETGIDAAVCLQEQGFTVTIVEAKKRIMPQYSWLMAERMRRALEQRSITVMLDCELTNAQPTTDGGMNLVTKQGVNLTCDLVVVCVGTTPRTSILAHAGAAVLPSGLIRVDDYLETSLRGVYACGSIIGIPHVVTKEVSSARNKLGCTRAAWIAGNNAAQEFSARRSPLAPSAYTNVVEIGEQVFARTGLADYEGRAYLGDKHALMLTATKKRDDAFEYGVKLVVDSQNEVIVGGEVWGSDEVFSHLDLLSIAVTEKFGPRWLGDLERSVRDTDSATNDLLINAAIRAQHVIDHNVNVMSADTLALWLASKRQFRLVDVSDAPILSGRVAKKTLHIPLSALRARIEELRSSDIPLVVVSTSAYQSFLAESALRQHGLTDIYHLDGGAECVRLMAQEEQ